MLIFLLVNIRNVYLCVWTGLWTHGILSPEHTARGYNVSSRKCKQDAQRGSLPITTRCS